jgi:hypothetical protein
MNFIHCMNDKWAADSGSVLASLRCNSREFLIALVELAQELQGPLASEER